MRYLLFSFEQYYPSGGWDDFVGAFESIDKAKAFASAQEIRQWGQIVDLDTMKVISHGEYSSEIFGIKDSDYDWKDYHPIQPDEPRE